MDSEQQQPINSFQESQTSLTNKNLSSQDVKESELKRVGPHWCSWCFKNCFHLVVQENNLSRNILKCEECFGRGAICFKCKQATSRYQVNSGPEKFCVVCFGWLKEGWNEDYRVSLKIMQLSDKWCSWCFKKSNHTLNEPSFITRSVYRCNQCGQRTLPCKNCSDSMCRGSLSKDDWSCFKCQEFVTSWENREENLDKQISKSMWCSWCIEKSDHVRQQKPTVGRTIYQCKNCKNRTLLCTVCKKAFTRGGLGWDDNLCASCSVESRISWDTLYQTKEAIFNQLRDKNRVLAELKRDSKFRQQAEDIGMLRPFLLLVGMPPFNRALVASHLGWSTLTQSNFGDPHAEAWDIVGSKATGLSSRCNQSYEKLVFASTSNWYWVLTRVMDVIFSGCETKKKYEKQSNKQCNIPNNEAILCLEEEFLTKLVEMVKSQLSEEQLQEFERPGKEMDEFREQIRLKTHISNVDIANYTAALVNSITNTSTTIAMNMVGFGVRQGMGSLLVGLGLAGTPLMLIGLGTLVTGLVKLVLGSSEGRLFAPLSLILNQRLLLAVEGIDLEELLHPDSTQN